MASEIMTSQPVQQDGERPEVLGKPHSIGDSVAALNRRDEEKGRRRYANVLRHADNEPASAGFGAMQDAQHIAASGSRHGA